MVSVVSNLPLGDQGDGQAIDAWLDSMAKKLGKDERALVRDACELAAQVHQGEQQDSGEGTMRYLLSVADILAGLGMDYETLAAAILHDVLASDSVDIELLRERFGKGVAGMVEDMARIGLVAGIQRGILRSEEQHAENLRRMLLSIADDVRVVLIVLAECLHDMRALKHMPQDVQHRVALETREIYAPLANRLGVWHVKWELEDLALRYLEPETYQKVAGQLDGRRGERERFIADVIKLLQAKFRGVGVKAEISGRPKHINSIWRKMKRKAVDFDQIFDLRAVRVLVDNVADCYAALGVVHGLWRHIPGEFDDYIATPKSNMYQSLHTAVIGPGGKTLEVQIRTHEMHHHSELGVAAHWTYKEGGSKHDAEFERRIMMMRNWLELKDEESGAEDFFDRFKSEFEPMQVYVLTPQGKVIELPMGSTPVDFAYAIHSDVGHRCRGAKVDGHIVPLTHQLESGHTVEIITVREGGPSRDWLSAHHGYIKTARARNRVRQWFRHQDYEQHVQLGRASLERELNRLGVGKPNLEQLAGKFNFRKVDDLLAAIGRGDISPIQVAGATGERRQVAPVKKKSSSGKNRGKEKARGEVIVEGVDDLMTNMARCCKPVPYDPIIGYITQGRGVTVHRNDCTMISRLEAPQQERLIRVIWSDQQAGASYPVDVHVSAQDRKGLLGDISAIFTNEELDIVGVISRSNRKTDTASMQFTVEIADIRQLSRVLNKIAQLPEVFEVRRRV